MSSSDAHPAESGGVEGDPRVIGLRNRLNEALLEVQHGEYFRARIHGWLAYREDAEVELPESLARRLTSPFKFTRPADATDVCTLDAFVIAYHAAESFCRQGLALVDGSGPVGAPLIAMTELRAGPAFSERLATVVGLPDRNLTALLDFLFLPQELQATWRDEPPSIESVQEYLRLWFRFLARYTVDWRNPYNAAKHGLAVGARPAELTFVTEGDSKARPVSLMDGPMLRTVEHEPALDAEGRATRGPGGKKALRWFWMYRAVDPEELIAQSIVTADLLDWLHAIASARLTSRANFPITVRSEPRPLDIQRRTSPGSSFRIDLAAVPLPPDQAEAVLSRLEGE